MLKIRYLTPIIILFMLCLLLNSLLNVQDRPNKHTVKLLNISGSASMQEVCENLSYEFMKKYKNVEVAKSSTGSAEAPIAVLNSFSNIGDISKPLTKEQHPDLFKIHVIAYDGIAICVNKSLENIKDISLANLRKIFSGEINNWIQLGGPNEDIVVVGRDEASGTRETFENILNLKGKCKYSVILENNGKIKFKIQNDKYAIGYLSFSAVDGEVKPLKIDGIAASYNNILNKKYHFVHPLIQITKKNSVNELVELWFKFIFSQRGREIIEASKLIPAKLN